MVLQGCCAGLTAVPAKPRRASCCCPEHPMATPSIPQQLHAGSYLGVVHQLVAPREALVKLREPPWCNDLAGRWEHETSSPWAHFAPQHPFGIPAGESSWPPWGAGNHGQLVPRLKFNLPVQGWSNPNP